MYISVYMHICVYISLHDSNLFFFKYLILIVPKLQNPVSISVSLESSLNIRANIFQKYCPFISLSWLKSFKNF